MAGVRLRPGSTADVSMTAVRPSPVPLTKRNVPLVNAGATSGPVASGIARPKLGTTLLPIARGPLKPPTPCALSLFVF